MIDKSQTYGTNGPGDNDHHGYESVIDPEAIADNERLEKHSKKSTHDSTIDWDRFWSKADDTDRDSATPSTHHVRELLADFFREKGVPDSFADVGCGPGVVAFHVAEHYPEMTVVAYVAASDRALQHLYDAVAPGGHLVLGYTNRLGQAHCRRLVESPENHPDPDFDADRFAERFRLVLDGESTSSYRRIHASLGTWPRSFWEFTDKPEERWAWNHVPLVWVPK